MIIVEKDQVTFTLVCRVAQTSLLQGSTRKNEPFEKGMENAEQFLQ